jgi:hypothetical protein
MPIGAQLEIDGTARYRVLRLIVPTRLRDVYFTGHVSSSLSSRWMQQIGQDMRKERSSI